MVQPPLLPWSGNGDGKVYFDKEPKREAQPSEPLPPEIEFERRPENEIVVPERLTKVHPLVEKTRTLLKGCRPTAWGRGLIYTEDGLDVRVSPASLPRALRIMQALIAALEQRGHKVTLFKGERHRGIAVTLGGEQIVFHLVEHTSQKLTGKDYPRYDLVPNGTLSFEIGDWWSQRVLSDGKLKKLEDRLNDFIVKLWEEAFKERRHREERERQEAERREKERLRAIEEEKRKAEEKKIAQWDEWMKAWRRAREVRAFVRAAKRRLTTRVIVKAAQDALQPEQLAFALAHASMLRRLCFSSWETLPKPRP